MTNATQTAAAFDYATQSALIKAYLDAKADHKAQRDQFKLKEGKLELALIFPAMEYASLTFDLQPLAFIIKDAKPSAIAKRAIKAIFPTFDFALVGDAKRPAFVHNEAMVKVADSALLAIVRDAFDAGDSVNCDQIKKAFPAPDTSKAQAMEKLGKALAARMKADNLTKDDIANILKGL